jgi:hypothetical protein
MEKMNIESIKNLTEIIKNNWEEIITQYNKHIEEKFEDFFLMTYSEYFKGAKTQEITKIISPVFNSILSKVLKPSGFNRCETDGVDYNFEGVAIEGKITLSTSNSWTGNGYKKTNWHLLVKLNLNEDGIVISSFCALAPIDECNSKWTTPTLDSNFSSLKFDNIDYDKIVIIKGKLEEKTKLLSPILL